MYVNHSPAGATQQQLSVAVVSVAAVVRLQRLSDGYGICLGHLAAMAAGGGGSLLSLRQQLRAVVATGIWRLWQLWLRRFAFVFAAAVESDCGYWHLAAMAAVAAAVRFCHCGSGSSAEQLWSLQQLWRDA